MMENLLNIYLLTESTYTPKCIGLWETYAGIICEPLKSPYTFLEVCFWHLEIKLMQNSVSMGAFQTEFVFVILFLQQNQSSIFK